MTPHKKKIEKKFVGKKRIFSEKNAKNNPYELWRAASGARMLRG